MRSFLCTAVLSALFPALALLPAGAGAATPAQALPPAQALQTVEGDNALIQSSAQAWENVQAQMQAYSRLSSFAPLAGRGPQVQTVFGIEQCHNAHWDGNDELQPLVTGGLNLAGDAEAEAYALQIIDTQFVQDVGSLLVADAQSGQGTTNQTIQALETATTALNTELQALGNQIAAALGPNSTLRQLPLANTWQAGIGDYPDLSAVQWIPGPSDGAPIGWVVRYDLSPLARLLDQCPTGRASLPMVSAAPILAVAQQAVQDEPDMAPLLTGLENGSTWQLAYGGGGTLSGGQIWNPLRGANPYYQQRVQLLQALGTDLGQVAGYMQPVDASLATFVQEAQVVTQSLEQEGS